LVCGYKERGLIDFIMLDTVQPEEEGCVKWCDNVRVEIKKGIGINLLELQWNKKILLTCIRLTD
jgi:hypothetical protein